METQLLVLFSVGTLLVLNGLFGRTSLLEADDARSVLLESTDERSVESPDARAPEDASKLS